MSKKTIKLTEADFKNMIKESVTNILSELDWKTYADAAQRRYQQADGNPQNKNSYDKAKKLADKADRTFNDEYVGNWKYDALYDKLRGKNSAKFNGFVEPGYGKNLAFGTLKGQNKGGSDIYSYKKGVYRNGNGGLTTPGKHFRNKEIADAYSRANDELWDYADGNYEYVNGEGWKLKESIDNALKSVLKEFKNNYRLNEISDYLDNKEYCIDILDIEFPDPIERILEEVADKNYRTVSVNVIFRIYPYDKGDYYTEPSGGPEYETCEVDVDGKFRNIIPEEYYEAFKECIAVYVEDKSDNYYKDFPNNDE